MPPANSQPGWISGQELDYVERTSDLTVTATAAASAQAWIDGNAILLDGNLRIKIECWASLASISTGQVIVFELYDGGTDLGVIGQIGDTSNAALQATVKGERFLTPSAASHTFHVKAWKTGGTAVISGGSGGGGLHLPAFYRVTVA